MIREINDKDYTFRMTRAGIRAAERAGMSMSDIGAKPMESLYFLWYAALYAEHPMVLKKSDALLDDYLDSADCPESFDDLFGDLAEQYAGVFNIAAE
ncbi:hypothetical protein EL753P1_00024 [Eggerthella phage EL753P1]|jgi:hypothetical protein|nr:hypothetical protein EL753P1_00024 [Eggerthella phage EL753P1]